MKYRRMDSGHSPTDFIQEQIRANQKHLGSIYSDVGSGSSGSVETKKNNEKSRQRRSVLSLPPPDSIHGGERAHMIPAMENLMNNLGFEGRDCMLRAMCEIHEYPLQGGYGLFGEIFTLVFTYVLVINTIFHLYSLVIVHCMENEV